MNSNSPKQPTAYADALRQTRRVFVRDLEVMASVGVFEHEKRYVQPIIVSVDLMVRDDYDDSSDDLMNVLDYGKIVSAIETIVDGQHVNLIETLAERIAQSCLADKTVYAVKVAIEKPDAFVKARSVGIEIERLAPAT